MAVLRGFATINCWAADLAFVTAAVVDPFGNILGVMYNPHYLEVLRAREQA